MKTFVPGTNYFSDSIISITNGNFNIEPFVSYSDEFSKRISSTSNIINKMFEFDVKSSKLTQANIFDIFLLNFKESISNLNDINKINKDQAIINSLFKLANQDLDLKNCLFDFCLLLGLASSLKNSEKKVFDRIKTDIPTINSLNSFKTKTTIFELKGGYSYLKPFLDELAERIENIVFSKLNFSTSVEDFSRSKRFFLRRPFNNITNRKINFSTSIIKNSNSNMNCF